MTTVKCFGISTNDNLYIIEIDIATGKPIFIRDVTKKAGHILNDMATTILDMSLLFALQGARNDSEVFNKIFKGDNQK